MACVALERHLEEEGSSVTALSLPLTRLLSNYVHHPFDFSFQV